MSAGQSIQKRRFPLASKSEIVEFIEKQTSLKVGKIESLGNGLVYCRLFEILFPGSIQTKKVKLLAKQEWDYQNNLRVLQKAFQQHNIEKNIEIAKLAQCKFQDNLNFMQWFIKFFEENKKDQIEQQPTKKTKTIEIVYEQLSSGSQFHEAAQEIDQVDLTPLQEVFSTSANKEEVKKDLNYELSACKMTNIPSTPTLCSNDKENFSNQINQNISIIDNLFEKCKADEI